MLKLTGFLNGHTHTHTHLHKFNIQLQQQYQLKKKNRVYYVGIQYIGVETDAIHIVFNVNM